MPSAGTRSGMIWRRQPNTTSGSIWPMTWRAVTGEGRVEEAAPLAAEAREIFKRLRAAPYLERLDRLPVPATAPAG